MSLPAQPCPPDAPRAASRWGQFVARRRQGTVLLSELLSLIGVCALASAVWFPQYVGHAPTPPKEISAAAFKKAYAPPPDSWVARNPLTGQMQRYYRVCGKRRWRHHGHRPAHSTPVPAYLLRWPYGPGLPSVPTPPNPMS